MKDKQPPLDAEQVSTDDLKDAFLQPPGIGAFPPGRSTLLVGARGSGKTMLLRTARHHDDYVAIYGDLRKILNGVSADTGVGGLSFNEIAPSEEGYLHDKTAGLLMLWLAQESKKRDVAFSREQIVKVLPPGVRSQIPNDDQTIEWLDENLPTITPGMFRRAPNLDILYDLIDEFAERVRNKCGKNLLLLLDRAEEVPFPCLVPVLRLLDQNHSFRVVIACRPGILGSTPAVHPSLPRAGDHYDVRHLGYAPYSKEWRKFQVDVLRVWIPKSLEAIPHDALETLLKICRDSMRCALELVYNSIEDDGRYSESRSRAAVENLKTMLFGAVQGSLRKLNDDIGGILKAIRQSPGYKLPVLLEIPSADTSKHEQLHLLDNANSFHASTRTEQFVRLALRTWLLSVPDGTHWSPFVRLDALELNPIFLWDWGDTWEA